ncbi:hypothetical protein RIF29_24061 [Crotalaria pallida]|uniref:Uncharacterized protein n=1 Tax=Crotalaria pallida TaxID=3830 RepID=A0AAN9EJ38_CROPI
MYPDGHRCRGGCFNRPYSCPCSNCSPTGVAKRMLQRSVEKARKLTNNNGISHYDVYEYMLLSRRDMCRQLNEYIIRKDAADAAARAKAKDAQSSETGGGGGAESEIAAGAESQIVADPLKCDACPGCAKSQIVADTLAKEDKVTNPLVLALGFYIISNVVKSALQSVKACASTLYGEGSALERPEKRKKTDAVRSAAMKRGIAEAKRTAAPVSRDFNEEERLRGAEIKALSHPCSAEVEVAADAIGDQTGVKRKTDDYLCSEKEIEGSDCSKRVKGTTLLSRSRGEKNEEKEKEIKQEFGQTCDLIKKRLGDKVAGVQISNRLGSSPCVLMSGKFGWSPNMERLMKAQTMGDSSSLEFMRSRRVFEINPDHAIIRNLDAACKTNPDDEEALRAIDLLYDAALVSSGFMPENPAQLGGKIYEMMGMALGGKWSTPNNQFQHPSGTTQQPHHVPETIEAEVFEPVVNISS